MFFPILGINEIVVNEYDHTLIQARSEDAIHINQTIAEEFVTLKGITTY